MIYIDCYRHRRLIITIQEKRLNEARRIQDWINERVRKAELRGHDSAMIARDPRTGEWRYSVDKALLRFSERAA